jgi:hypothetical protein
MARRWTDEEDALLLKLRSEGFSTTEMYHYLHGRTVAAIRARINKIATDNLNRHWSQEEKDLVLQMKAEKKTNRQIARAIKRTPRAVEAFLSRHGDNATSHTSG